MTRFYLIAIFVLLLSCNNEADKPDVSDIKVNISVQRFEKDLFGIDTNNVRAELARLEKKYPHFLPVFTNGLLGIDSGIHAEEQIKFFIRQGMFLYSEAEKKYSNFNRQKEGFTRAFQYVKFYFPNYKVPGIVTLIGPIDALAKLGETYTPNFIAPDYIGISLQFYMGKNFPLYQNENYILQVAPAYRSQRFDEEYIVPDVMKLVADDIYPDRSTGTALIDQMIEKGKQWFLLDKFLPDAADSVKTGYTKKQLDWVEENEGNVWGYIIKNENLYSIEPPVIQTYLGEAPFTQGMPETSPGNLGQWIGWRIVQKFAEKNEKLSVGEILKTPAKDILEGAKYRPK